MANQTGKGCFKPGKSGNPGGRPAVAKEVRAQAMQHSAEAIEVLVKLMRNEKAPPAARAAAANAVLDRAVGKPESSLNAKIETTETKPDFSVLSPDELEIWHKGHAMLAPLIDKVLHQNSEHETEGLSNGHEG